MRERHQWVMLWAVAAAVWMSDRWWWMVPGLLGVLGGAQLVRHRQGKAADPQMGKRLGSALILTGMAYLYVVLIVLELLRWRALAEESEFSQAHPTPFLIGASVVVLLALLIWGALLLFKLPPPRWLTRLWDFLLQ